MDYVANNVSLKWYRQSAHLGVRGLAIMNMALTALWPRFEDHLVNQVTGILKPLGALLVGWVELCPIALLVFIVVGLAQLGSQKPDEASFKKQQLSLYIDGVVALAALLLSSLQPHAYAEM